MRRALPGLLGSALLAAAFLTGPPAHAAQGCTEGHSDLNGDGWSDAVVADPYATVSGRAEAGRILVLYGGDDGRIGQVGAQLVSQDSPGVDDAAETGDRFGSAISVDDENGDGCDDVLVGVPDEDHSALADAGLAQVIYGDPLGLGAGTRSQELTAFWDGQSSETSAPRAGDRLGSAVDLLGDVEQGGTPGGAALAVGIPGRDVGGRADAGAVGMEVAFDGGNESYLVTQDTAGVPGAAEAGDRFGASVTFGFLDDRGLVDGAFGAPGEDLGPAADAGMVVLLSNIYGFPGTDGSGVGTALDQNSPGVPGVAEAGDEFGAVLDSTRVGNRGHLAVGVPREDAGAEADAGSVQLFSSDRSALVPGVGLSQDTAGVGGVTEPGDRFGSQVSLLPPSPGESRTLLGVSAPYEDGSLADTGSLQVFPVNDLDADVGWSQSSPGVPGAAAAGDRFGTALAGVLGNAEGAFLVGVPYDTAQSTGMVDVIPVGGGSPRAWTPGQAGAPTAGSERFGLAVGGRDR